jgi:hypothetical protein
MHMPNATLLVPAACVLFMAGCSAGPDAGHLKHPTMSPADQAIVRADCTRAAQTTLGPAPPAAAPAVCREDGDLAARDRCRAQADLVMMAQTRYIQRLDLEVASCLRTRGFRD